MSHFSGHSFRIGAADSSTGWSVDSYVAPSRLAVHLRRCKNDLFVAGTTLHLGATGQALCPVSAILGYLAIRPPTQGPLFFSKDASSLSRPKLVQSLRQVLSSVGVVCSSYSGHSFRIGAATSAARTGVSDSLIKTLGRWESSAFMLYIQMPLHQLTEVSSVLARNPPSTSHAPEAGPAD